MFRSTWGFLIGVVSLLICVHLVYFFVRSTGPRNLPTTSQVAGKDHTSKPLQVSARKAITINRNGPRAKAAIVILARNTDLNGLQKTIRMFEQRFNRKFNYPYVLLNDVPFSQTFKEEFGKLTKSKVSFGTVPKEHWSYPAWINVTKADLAREDMHQRNIIYGGSLSYRHMCRFNSGFFFRHPLLDEFEFYWRVEPSVEFYCDIDYDPFLFMKQNDKKYGFVIMLHEYWETIPSLWKTTLRFMEENKGFVTDQNALDLVRRQDGTYNGCHFWSNFEIASLEFLRSEKYLKYFEFLDREGGFFYERWGDAPVHSIAAAMFLPMNQIHYFEDIGYFHGPFFNCPANPALQLNCKCNPLKNINNDHECFRVYKAVRRSQPE